MLELSHVELLAAQSPMGAHPTAHLPPGSLKLWGLHRYLLAPNPVIPKQEHYSLPGDIWQGLGTCLIVTAGGWYY